MAVKLPNHDVRRYVLSKFKTKTTTTTTTSEYDQKMLQNSLH